MLSLHITVLIDQERKLELVDGYLTPNSWYRPVTILENGENGVSTEKRLRPL